MNETSGETLNKPEQDTGTYLCRDCGEFFQTKVTLATTCPHCGSTQLSVNTWQRVINHRENELGFERGIEIEGEIDRSDPYQMKLDVVGRKGAFRKLAALCLIFAVLQDVDPKPSSKK